MAIVIAVVSDTHAGSTVGLCPPAIQLDDGGEYRASRPQLWLWELWRDFWQTAQELREKHKAQLYTLFNGDLVEGNHHGTTQILSGNPNAQAQVVNECMGVVLKLEPDKMFVVRGTESHVGASASAEERIADGLWRDGRPIQRDPDTGTASWWHLRAEIEGIRLDCAHHGRMGQRPWTKGNVVQNLAAQIFYEHAADGIPHPHLAIRSHLHRHADTHDAHPTRVIQTPAWQLATAYVHKVAADSIADVGGICIVIDDGRFTVHNAIHRPSRGSVWRSV